MSFLATAGALLAQSYDLYSSSYDAAATGLGLGFTGIWVVVYCCAAIVGIAALAFNIWMLVDVLKRTEAELPNKNMWMILLIVGLVMGFGAIVALVYFFSVKKKLGPVKK